MMCAQFFAKMELQQKDQKKEFKDLDRKFSDIESMFINPAKIMDAKLFTINQKIQDIEQISNHQFSVYRKSVEKLVAALDGQSQGLFATTKLIIGLLVKKTTPYQTLTNFGGEQEEHAIGGLIKAAPAAPLAEPTEDTKILNNQNLVKIRDSEAQFIDYVQEIKETSNGNVHLPNIAKNVTSKD